jgi:tetratricopeptide (TPR) repeat protein
MDVLEFLGLKKPSNPPPAPVRMKKKASGSSSKKAVPKGPHGKHKPPAKQYASTPRYRSSQWPEPTPQPAVHQYTFWNPVNSIDLASRYRNHPAQDMVRSAQKPPPLLRIQSGWRQAEYYQELFRNLEDVKPEDVGLENLLEARLSAARRGTLGGLEAEMRAIHRVVASLCNIESEETDQEGWKTRKRARQYVAGRLGQLAEHAIALGDTDAALEAFRALEDTGEISERHLRIYGRLLSASEAASAPASLRIYLQCLERQFWQTERDPLLQAFHRELSAHLNIREHTPRQEIRKRMALIARMHAGGGVLNDPAKSLGLGYLLLEEPERAVAHLERACELDGHDGGESFFFLAQSLYRTGQWEKASAAFGAASERGFSPSRIAAWRGLALAKAGQWEAAFEAFEVAEQSLGSEADAAFYIYWAQASFRMGAFEQAKTRFNQAIEKWYENGISEAGSTPDLIRAHYGHAICLLREGNYDDATSQLHYVVGMKKDFAPASYMLGRLYKQLGKPDSALQYFRLAVEDSSDLVYLLSLALALDDAQQAAALPLFIKLIENGKGGPEVMRRTALEYYRRGDGEKARYWFKQLADAVPSSMDCKLWTTRYCATAATESFNRGQFAMAIADWELVCKAWEDQAVHMKLGLALLCDASVRLKLEWNSNLDSVWPRIARAHQLFPCWNSRYLNALAMLVHGDYPGSLTEFELLGQSAQDRPEIRFFAMLARYLLGDETALNAADTLEALPGAQGLNALVGLLQIQAAAHGGDFKLGAERIEAWFKLADCVQAAGSNRSQVNALVWLCIKRAGLRVQKFSRLVAGMKTQDEEFWKPALAVCGALEIVKKTVGEADPSRLEQVDQSLQSALESLAPADRGALQAELSTFLRYRIEDAVCRGDLVLATALLDRLEIIVNADSPSVARLREVLDKLLQFPSHEKAYALLECDPDAARSIWHQRLELHPGEYDSLQHLACLAWSCAYDAGRKADEARTLAEEMKETPERKQLESEVARDYEAAIAYFVEGLGYYRKLFDDPAYWEALRMKGRSLDTAANHFDEAKFEAWKSSALQDKARILIDFSIYIAHCDKKGGTARAKSALARLRSCGLPEKMTEALLAGFAERSLDRDPITLSAEQFDPAMARAERVLQMDQDNTKALEFIVVGHTYRAETSKNEEAKVVAERIGSVRNRAEQLEKKMPGMEPGKRAQVNRNLAAYWEELGFKAKRRGGEFLDELNASPGYPFHLLRDIAKWLEESNHAFEQAVRLDSTIGLRTATFQENNRMLIGKVRERMP